MAEQSTLYQLLREKLGEDPVADMSKRRQRGDSWRAIERTYLLEHDISVTDVTLRFWYDRETLSPDEFDRKHKRGKYKPQPTPDTQPA